MAFFLAISRGIDRVTTAVGRVAWWLTIVMVLIGFLNVVTRYVGRSLGISLGGTLYIALQTYAFDLVFLLGAAYVFRKDAHVRVDILFSLLSARAKAIVDILGVALFLVPFALLGLYLSQGYIARSWRSAEINVNAGGIPIYPVKTVIAIAFALLIVQGISEVIKNTAFLAGHPASGSVHAHDEHRPGEHLAEQTEAI